MQHQFPQDDEASAHAGGWRGLLLCMGQVLQEKAARHVYNKPARIYTAGIARTMAITKPTNLFAVSEIDQQETHTRTLIY